MRASHQVSFRESSFPTTFVPYGPRTMPKKRKMVIAGKPNPASRLPNVCADIPAMKSMRSAPEISEKQYATQPLFQQWISPAVAVHCGFSGVAGCAVDESEVWCIDSIAAGAGRDFGQSASPLPASPLPCSAGSSPLARSSHIPARSRLMEGQAPLRRGTPDDLSVPFVSSPGKKRREREGKSQVVCAWQHGSRRLCGKEELAGRRVVTLTDAAVQLLRARPQLRAPLPRQRGERAEQHGALPHRPEGRERAGGRGERERERKGREGQEV